MSGQVEVESIELPKDIIDRIEGRISHTEFDTKSEYIEYILGEVLHQLEQENDLTKRETVDEQQVQDRLKSLGYLNE